MEKTFDTAYRILPTLNRDELTRLQERIVELLRGGEDGITMAIADEAELEAELDAAIAEFDGGKGYPADAMGARVRERFGW